MKLLTIDTATALLGMALTDDATLVSDYRLNQKNIHNEKVVASIHTLLQNAGWRLHELEGIIFSKGPGSFTGLRIGLSVCKGLASTLAIPIVGVNTLDALAEGVACWDGRICAMIKARANEAYFAVYQKSLQTVERLTDYDIAALSAFSNILQPNTMIISNPPDLLDEILSESFTIAPDEYTLLQPLVLARLGDQKIQANEIENLAETEPFYLKNFEPKQKKYY